jgi:hypothetical protein
MVFCVQQETVRQDEASVNKSQDGKPWQGRESFGRAGSREAFHLYGWWPRFRRFHSWRASLDDTAVVADVRVRCVRTTALRASKPPAHRQWSYMYTARATRA